MNARHTSDKSEVLYTTESDVSVWHLLFRESNRSRKSCKVIVTLFPKSHHYLGNFVVTFWGKTQRSVIYLEVLNTMENR